jgi:prepilin-type N-terminal cleavage/methylation domain-containing protein
MPCATERWIAGLPDDSIIEPHAPCRGFQSERGYSFIEMLVAAAVLGLIGGIAVPVTTSSVAAYRLKGDAQAVNNVVALAKMRASGAFTRARVLVDLREQTYVLQVWDKDAAVWVNDGGTLRTSHGVTFGYGALDVPPPNTQHAIALSPPCTTGVPGEDIPDTACVTFNSRGLPIQSDGTLYAAHSLYVTDGTGVYATTVTATPLIRFWWSPARAAAWKKL